MDSSRHIRVKHDICRLLVSVSVSSDLQNMDSSTASVKPYDFVNFQNTSWFDFFTAELSIVQDFQYWSNKAAIMKETPFKFNNMKDNEFWKLFLFISRPYIN